MDVQVSEPYKLWRHTHSFEVVPAGTLMRDTVDYALRLGPLGALVHALFVRSTCRGSSPTGGRRSTPSWDSWLTPKNRAPLP